MIKFIDKKIIGLLLFAIVTTVFFFYARFPGKVVENYLISSLAQRYPGTFFSLASVSLSIPPGLDLKNVLFGFKDNPDANIRIEQCIVRPRVLRYLTGRSSFAVNALAYGGSVKGIVGFPDFVPKNIPTQVEITVSGINLDKLSYLRDKLGRQITGKFAGTYKLNSDSQLTFTVQNGSYQLLESLFGMDKLDFTTVEGQISLKGGVIKISKLTVKGAKINCSLKGDIMVNSDLKQSVINLTGTMEIASLNNKKISLFLTGTLGNAQTRYL